MKKVLLFFAVIMMAVTSSAKDVVFGTSDSWSENSGTNTISCTKDGVTLSISSEAGVPGFGEYDFRLRSGSLTISASAGSATVTGVSLGNMADETVYEFSGFSPWFATAFYGYFVNPGTGDNVTVKSFTVHVSDATPMTLCEYELTGLVTADNMQQKGTNCTITFGAVKAEASTVAANGYGFKLDGNAASDNTKYVLVTTDFALEAGDKIIIGAYATSNPSSTKPYGVIVSTDRAAENQAGVLKVAGKNTEEALELTVAQGSPLVGKKSFYITRNTDLSTYFTSLEIKGVRTHTHNYATTWSNDENGHWHACSATFPPCDELKKDSVGHTYGEVATQAAYYTCSACEYENATRKTEYEAAVKAAADRAAADAVEDLIRALGPSDASDAFHAKIEAAQAAYDALTADQKALVNQGLLLALADASTGYNFAVANVVADKINAIGTVELTEACKAKIDEARAAYDALNSAQKASLSAEDLKVLTDAEKAYADLVAADAVVKKFNAIGTVALTEESKAKIDEARAAYDALTDDQKALVTEAQLKVLTDAEKAYADLVAADAAVKKINAIGIVVYNPECKARIDEARAAYDALTDDQKALVTEAQLKVLTDAETTYANLKAAQEYRDAHEIIYEIENSIKIEDKATVEEALEDLAKLPEAVQAYLTYEKQHLEDLLVRIGYLEAAEDLEDAKEQMEDLEGDRIAMILLNSDEELIKAYEEYNDKIEEIAVTIEKAKILGEPTSDEIKAAIAALGLDIEKLYDDAMALYPEGPYGPIIVEMMGFEQMTAKLNERDGDIRGDLKLTNLWNRVMDQIAAEANRLNWDIENNPEPSDLRLGFHFTNVALIHTSFAIYNEAVKQHLTKDEKIQAILDAIIELVSSRKTMVAQYGAVIEDDAEWQAISARLDAEEAAVNALEGTDPTIEELEAHEAELAAINAAMQAFAAKVESGTTAISSAAQNAESRMQNIYNLRGQKVSDNAKGIVIKNGKKVMVK